ncbi:MAG: sodium:solute symporter [Pseudomonadota bacterium]
MQAADWVIVIAYFVVIFAVAIIVTVRDKARGTPQDYFLAGKNVGWFIVGASLFASNIGSEHLVGLAGSGAAGGVAVAQFEILAGLILLLLGWLFVPFYLASGVFTMPEFLERRYSQGPRTYLAVISIIGYVLTKISVTIAAGGIVFQALMGIDFWTGALIVVIATGAYTAFGGLRAVLYTDMVQMFVLLGGAVAVTVVGLEAVGGWDALRAAAGPGYFNLWQPISHPEFPWTGILFGAPILGIWYWCTDQFIVQRVLSARDETAARRGAIFAGFLKQTPLFIFVLPGIIAYALAQSGALTLHRPDEALPALIAALLPAGLRGLVVAGLLAALMSSLSSVFNSCSTLFTMDIYRRLRPQSSPRHLVVVGQLAVIVLIGFGLAWIPFMKTISGQLFTYLQSVQAYIAPPIAAVFLIGVLWQRANAAGAIAALSLGFVLGLGRLLLEMNKASLSGLAHVLATVNFLHIALLLFFLSAAALVVVSLATTPPRSAQVAGLTYGGVAKAATEWKGARRGDMALTALLIAVIAALWVAFSG